MSSVQPHSQVAGSPKIATIPTHPNQVEHNVLTVAKYYTRISMARLAELLDLSADKVGDGGSTATG
jgi:hypothetical protein